MIIQTLDALIKDHQVSNQTRFHKKEYVPGEIDCFVHLDMKTMRQIAKDYSNQVDKQTLNQLFTHKYHEYRMVGLLVLLNQIKDKASLKASFDRFNQYIDYVNNWDLVDVSAPGIVGRYVDELNQEAILLMYTKSNNLWVNRIASVACLYLIKQNKLTLPLKIIEKQLRHNHDLMHKANGWMLREIGKQNIQTLNQFIKKHYQIMPRTTLRYAIEKHDQNIRKKILGGRFEWM